VTSWRRSFEQRLGPAVVVASRLPRAMPFLVVCALLVGGLVAQGLVGAVLLLLLAALLGVLLLLSWPGLQPGPRVLRLAVVGVVAARAVSFLS
jgi:hypothetical protein